MLAMNIYELAALIFVFGGVGGFANCLLVGSDRFRPGYDAQRNWLPGWSGSIVLGAIAAVVIWGVYGSSASYDLLGPEKFVPHLTLAQLLTSLVVGMGGSRILTLETQKLILRSQRDTEEQTKEQLINAAKALVTRK